MRYDYIKLILIVYCGWIITACNDLSVFVPRNPPSQLGKVTGLELDADGHLQLSWSTKGGGKTVDASIYLIELPESQTTYGFSGRAQFIAPLRSEIISVKLEDSPEKIGTLVASPEELSSTLKNDLDSHKYYLIQLVDNKGHKSLDPDVILAKVEFDPINGAAAAAAANVIHLDWNIVPGANSYKVYADVLKTQLIGASATNHLDVIASDFPGIHNFYVLPFRGSLAGNEAQLITLSASPVRAKLVRSGSPDGVYGEGRDLDLYVDFDDAVTVFGTTTLPLKTTSRTPSAAYVDGSGTSTLHYRYHTSVGDDVLRLDHDKVLAGSFVDAQGLTVAATLPVAGQNQTLAENAAISIDTVAPTAPVSVGFSAAVSATGAIDASWGASTDLNLKQYNAKICTDSACSIGCSVPQVIIGATTATFANLADNTYYACIQAEDSVGHASAYAASLGSGVVDTTPPTITRVSTPLADGTYNYGAIIPIDIAFSETVTVVNGSDLGLTLETGAVDRVATYVSGSGSNVLRFQYVVNAGDTTSLLNYLTTTSLSAGATGAIIDEGGLSNYVLPGLASASALAQQNHIVIDTSGAALLYLTVDHAAQNAFVGSPITLVDVNNLSPAGDTDVYGLPLTYTCKFDGTLNGTMDAGGTDCSSLSGAVTFSGALGRLSWTPDSGAQPLFSGIANYEFAVTATDPAGHSATQYFTVALLNHTDYVEDFNDGTIYNDGAHAFVAYQDAGKLKLPALSLTDHSNSGVDSFASGSFNGVRWDSALSALTLGASVLCDPTLKLCYDDFSQSPHPDRLVHEETYDGSAPGGGTVLTSDSKIGSQAVSFNGVDQNYYFSNPIGNDFTITFWMKTPSSYSESGCAEWSSGVGVVSMESPGVVNDFGVQMCDGYVQAGVGNPEKTVASLARVNDNQWHMVTFTRNKASGVINLYIDGAFQATDTGNNNYLNAHPWIDIGKRNSGAQPHWEGILDQLRMYDIDFSQADVAALFAQENKVGGGTFTSRTLSTGSEATIWGGLSWKTSLPFGKEFPDYANGQVQNETLSDYPGLSSGSLMDNIAGLWHLNETTAGTAPNGKDFKDNSGFASHGTIIGTVGSPVTGRFDSAVHFAGSGAVGLGTAASLSFAGNDFTASAWIKTAATHATPGRIIGNGANTRSDGWALELNGSSVAFAIGCSGGAASDCVYLTTNDTFNDDVWHQATAIVNRSTGRVKVFVDGKLRAVTASGTLGNCGSAIGNEWNIAGCPALSASRSQAEAFLGGQDGASKLITAAVDEIAVWSKPLTDIQALEIYRRGANRVSFVACLDNVCYGPQGIGATRFSEIQNRSTPTSTVSVVKPTSPSINLADFITVPGAGSFQYKVTFESDEINGLCGGSNCNPDVRSVTIDGPSYAVLGYASLLTNVPFYKLSGFTEVANCPSGGGTKYLIMDGNSGFRYWDGSSWATWPGDLNLGSTAADINAHISTFAAATGSTQIVIYSFLHSDGYHPCELDSFSFTRNASF